MNVLDHEYKRKVKSFFDLMYQRNLIPTINKPTRVGKNSTTAIDHITADLTDHFPIVIALKIMDRLSKI